MTQQTQHAQHIKRLTTKLPPALAFLVNALRLTLAV